MKGAVIVGAGSAGLSALREVRGYGCENAGRFRQGAAIRALQIGQSGHFAARAASGPRSPRGQRRRDRVARHHSLGPTLSQLAGIDIVSGTADFSAQPRRQKAQTTAGLLCILPNATAGGFWPPKCVCRSAEHLAHLSAVAVERWMTVADMLALPFYHPVLEGLRSAQRDLAKDVALADRTCRTAGR